jgi:Lamin Tail Domain
MRKILTGFLVLCGWVGLVTRPVQAEVIMTEVYPAPSDGFEWVELCNSGTESIALFNYVLLDSSGKKLSIPQIELVPQQYILATSSGVLNNTGDTVYLQKNGLTIESMNYDTPVNAQQSYISCNAVWTLTNSVTPGFENVGCATTPMPTTFVSAVTTLITQAPVITRTPAVSPRAVVSTTGTADAPAQTPEPTLPKQKNIISFQQKHAPVVLGNTASISPSEASKTLQKAQIHLRAPYDSRLLSIGTLTVTLALLLSLLVMYTTVQKLKTSYNETHDT